MKFGYFQILASGALALTLTACLQTRESQKEQDEKLVLKKQLSTLQMSTADIGARFQDIEEENRRLSGRVEALEARLSQFTAQNDKSGSVFETKMRENNEIYTEEFGKLNIEIQQLREQLAAMRDEQRKAVEARAAESAKNPWSSAEEKFEKKEWREAILDFEKYRSQNPNGKHVAAATYKIAESFQELGMKEEARAFFEEVIARFPKSKEAGKASAKVKALSKKKK